MSELGGVEGGGSLNSEATAVLRFDASGVRPGVNEANAALGALYGTIKDNWWGIQNLGTAFAGIGAAITGGLASAGNAAVQFEAQTTQVFKNLPDSAKLTSASMETIRQGLLNIAKDTPTSITELNKYAQFAAGLGVPSGQIVAFTKDVADLINVTQLTENDVQPLVRLANQFDVPLENFKQLGNVIFEVGKNSAATEPEIISIATRLGAYTSAIGFTVEQTVGLAGALKSVGLTSESSSTAVVNTIQQMARAANQGGPALEDFAKLTGTTVAQFKDLVAQDPSQAFLKFIQGLGEYGTNAVTINKVLDDLDVKGKRQVGTLTALASAMNGNGSGASAAKDLAQAYKIASDAMNDNAGFAAEVARVYDTTAAKTQIFKNNIAAVKIEMGDDYQRIFKAALGPLQDIVVGFGDLPAPVRQTVEAIAGLTGGSALLIGGFALLFARLGPIVNAMQSFKTRIVETQAAQRELAALQQELGLSEDELAAKQGFRASNSLTQIQAQIAALREKQAMDLQEAAAQEAQAEALNLTAQAQNNLNVAQGLYLELQATEQQIIAANIAGNAEESEALLGKAQALRAASEAAAADALATKADAEAATIAAEEQIAAAAAARELATAEGEATVASGVLKIALATLTGPIGFAVLAIGTLLGGLGGLGASEGDTQAKTEDLTGSIQSLAQAMNEGGDAALRQLANQVPQIQGYNDLKNAADKAGFSIGQVVGEVYNATLKGGTATIGSKLSQDFYSASTQLDAMKAKLADLKTHLDEGDTSKGTWTDYNNLKGQVSAQQQVTDSAKAAWDAYSKLSAILGQASDQAKDLGDIDKNLGVSAAGATDATKALGLASADQTSAQAKAAKAGLDLIDARKALLDATDAVTQAETSYATQQESATQKALDLRSAELSLQQARQGLVRADQAVAEAEHALNLARSTSIKQLHEDERQYNQDKLTYAEDTLKVADAQKAYSDAQKGTDYLTLIDLTNKLHDAQDSLWKATEKVGDAQFNLQYLIGQGASARDIADAQEQLREANDAQADAAKKATDANNDLAKAQAGPDPEAIAKAWIDLQKALEDQAKALGDTRNDLAKINQDKKDVSSDKAYKEAQEKVTDALLAQKQAALQVQQAEEALKKQQEGTAAAASAASAEKSLNNALFAQAQAIANVKEQQDQANGKTDTAAEKTQIFKSALQQVYSQLSGPTKTAFGEFLTQLGLVPKDKSVTVNADTSKAAKALQDFAPTLNEIITGLGGNAKTILTDIMGQAGADSKTSFQNHMNSLLGFLTGVFNPNLRTAFATGMTLIDGIISDHVNNKQKPVIDSVPTGIQNSLGNLATILPNILTSPLKTLRDTAQKLFDAITGGGNNIWSTILRIAGTAIGNLLFPAIKLPLFAEGGVATQATAGVFGEAGPEAIVPLDRFASMFAPLDSLSASVATLAAAIDHAGGGGGSATYHITVPDYQQGSDIMHALAFFEMSH